MKLAPVIAMNRFGLGIRSGTAVPHNSKNWLRRQLSDYDPAPATLTALPSRKDIAEQFLLFRTEVKKLRTVRMNAETAGNTLMERMERRKVERRKLRKFYTNGVDARLAVAARSNTDFAERLVHFWSNHFSISIEKIPVAAMAGNFEFEAIRPNVLGKFSDLLTAAILHPAMLIYLDQAQSIGPNSAAAKRFSARRKREFGLNENLAREILELHTLGVRSGYRQTDVTELARILTGWTVTGFVGGPVRRFGKGQGLGNSFYADPVHEPGSHSVLGKRYDGNGRQQLLAIISDLSVHPATARHVAKKLAKHFVSDDPPPSLVSRLERNFLNTGGDLTELYESLINAPESWPEKWEAGQAKFKSPWEWAVSSFRAMGMDELRRPGTLANVFQQLGQPIWRPGSPAGYADDKATWNGGSALMRRLDFANRLAQLSGGQHDPRALGSEILPDILSDNSRLHIARAASPEQGLALLFMSPEFLRR